MKSKFIFFIIITFLVALKWSYNFIYSENTITVSDLNLKNNNSNFDSVNECNIYKHKMLQNISDNKVVVNNLKSAIVIENVLIKDILEKQIEGIEFKNNQLELRINNYRLESVSKFQFFKTNFNSQMEENKKLTADLIEKHQTILKRK